VAFLILLSIRTYAQEKQEKSRLAKFFHDEFPFDSSYVSSFPTKPLGKVFVNNKSHDFYLRTVSGRNIQYKPGRANGYGFGLVYHQLALEVSFTPPQKFNINQSSSNGRFDINTTLFNNRYGVDLLFQNYRGYEMDQPESILPSWNPENAFIRNDIVSTFIGLNFFYVQNPRKFSFRSSFMGDQIQHKSAGSIIYGAYLNTLNIQGSEAIVPDSAININSDMIGIKRIGNASAGFLMGFGYNFVLHKGLFFSLVGIPGMGIALGGKSERGYFTSGPRLFPQVMLNARASLGYNSLKWHTSLQWIENLGAYEFGSESRVSINQSKLKLTLGYRFQHPLRYKNKLI
jgi:hypothetical protein